VDWRQRSVLVTGGTGSFGTTFVDVALRLLQPRRLIVFSRDELKQSEMAKRFSHPSLRFFVGDVRDRDRLQRAMHGVDIVIHAAALKQVPACEYNPFEAVKTNVVGANNVIEAAIDQGVERVMALSTDKAVNPVNIYGATKLCAEKLFVQGNSYAGGLKTRMAVVRYGNVVGSRGSVIPIFLEQRDNGQLTITDERMTRFWLTLEQGVRFVIGCIERMQGGEIFVPKIPSVRVVDLARAMAPSLRHRVVGIRPGEKLHEIMCPADDSHLTLEFDDHFVIKPTIQFVGFVDFARNALGETGRPVDQGFEYHSGKNPVFLGIEEIAEFNRIAAVG
jgi:UDP-N-acetylglucosamine 4,6-dehydratase